MKLFPQGVRLVVGPSAAQSTVVDIATGEIVEHVRGVSLALDTVDKPEPVLLLRVCGVRIEAEAQNARYLVDDDTMRRLAEANGYDIAKRAQ